MSAANPIITQSEPAQVDSIHTAGTDPIPLFLRGEALVEMALTMMAYRYLGGTWEMFVLLFLVPDASMAGYLVNLRAGARVYNLAHTYIAPALLALLGFLLAIPVLYSLALIWAAHIGFDRFAGYGLKYPAAFTVTHLSWKGYSPAKDHQL